MIGSIFGAAFGAVLKFAAGFLERIWLRKKLIRRGKEEAEHAARKKALDVLSEQKGDAAEIANDLADIDERDRMRKRWTRPYPRNTPGA